MEILFKNGATANVKVATAVALRHVVTAGDVTATAATFNLTADLAAIDDVVIDIKRAGVRQTAGTVTIVNTLATTTTTGTRSVAIASGTYTLTAGDIITGIVFGSTTN